MLLPHLPTLGRRFRRRQGSFTWRCGEWHIHKLLVIFVEFSHLNLVQEFPMAVNLAAETFVWSVDGSGVWDRQCLLHVALAVLEFDM